MDALDTRTSGLTFDQPDEPWWATAIREWLAMCAQIQAGMFPGADGWRAVLADVLAGGAYRTNGGTTYTGSEAVYAVYADWRLAARRE